MKPYDEVDHVSICIDEKLNGLSPIPTENCIFKVHNQLRKVNETAYEPQILAIGPYHRSKASLQAMEEHKLRYLQQLLRRISQSCMETYVSALRELEERARKCYAESISLNTDEFVEMLLLDGCFIVELFRKCAVEELRDENDPIFKMAWIGYSLENDLMLFENQLPFFVLRKLFEMTETPNDQHNIVDLALNFFAFKIPNLRSIQDSHIKIPVHEITYLLGLVHHTLVRSFARRVSFRNSVARTRNDDWEFIRCATELKDTGVKFKKKERGKMFDVKFKDMVMEIPPLVIEDQTESVLRNLIAHEQYRQEDHHHHHHHLNYVTDYVIFMSYLIKSPKDVELLRLHGIIINWIGGDEVVFTMFNKLGSNVIVSNNVSDFCYAEISCNVNAHCRSRWKTSMGILRHNYFHSPWTLLSVLAGVSLVLLAFTWTVFSLLSYIISKL